jgi:saccharopine dehydrogenase (NAD+, L-lysine-forming)
VYNTILDDCAKYHQIEFKEKHFKAQLWIRHEVKKGEERVIFVPSDCKKLIDAGYKVTVEKSTTRCIKDEEYAKVGCELVEAETWVNAPDEAYICGLKELPDMAAPLRHRHIYFAHCFKNQSGWAELLNRFHAGRGSLLDLEFLVDDQGRRVAAFGRAAGQAGAALGLAQWAHQFDKSVVGNGKPIKSWASKEKMIADIKSQLDAVKAKYGKSPTAHVIGAKGRCGGGAVGILKACGIEKIVEWDLEETKGTQGPYPALLDQDVLINCIYLPPGVQMKPYLTLDMVKSKSSEQKLSVFVDVSCDATNPYNPFPLYSKCTTMDEPIEQVLPGFDVCSIDHLPSLIPLESSQDFSADLLRDGVMTDLTNTKNKIFANALNLFKTRKQEAVNALLAKKQ